MTQHKTSWLQRQILQNNSTTTLHDAQKKNQDLFKSVSAMTRAIQRWGKGETARSVNIRLAKLAGYSDEESLNEAAGKISKETPLDYWDNSNEFLEKLAGAYAASDEPEKSISILTKVLNSEPKSEHLRRANLFRRLGATARLIPDFPLATKYYAEAEMELQLIVSVDQDDDRELQLLNLEFNKGMLRWMTDSMTGGWQSTLSNLRLKYEGLASSKLISSRIAHIDRQLAEVARYKGEYIKAHNLATSTTQTYLKQYQGASAAWSTLIALDAERLSKGNGIKLQHEYKEIASWSSVHGWAELQERALSRSYDIEIDEGSFSENLEENILNSVRLDLLKGRFNLQQGCYEKAHVSFCNALQTLNFRSSIDPTNAAVIEFGIAESNRLALRDIPETLLVFQRLYKSAQYTGFKWLEVRCYLALSSLGETINNVPQGTEGIDEKALELHKDKEISTSLFDTLFF